MPPESPALVVTRYTNGMRHVFRFSSESEANKSLAVLASHQDCFQGFVVVATEDKLIDTHEANMELLRKVQLLEASLNAKVGTVKLANQMHETMEKVLGEQKTEIAHLKATIKRLEQTQQPLESVHLESRLEKQRELDSLRSTLESIREANKVLVVERNAALARVNDLEQGNKPAMAGSF